MEGEKGVAGPIAKLHFDFRFQNLQTLPVPISFEAFMQQALHDPQRGYYARHIENIGQRGDFTTAPMLGNDLAKAIADWATRTLRESGCRNMIEIGPGTGQLAAAVWERLPWSLRWKCQLHLVERSIPLTTLQRQKLKGKARWHATVEAALEACKGRAVIYSNELVDAFPVRRFEQTAEGWQEIAVTLEHPVTESLLPCPTLPDSTIFELKFPIGQQVEVHESYQRWLDQWLPLWKHGRLLTIDYGAEAANLYRRQPKGSIRAYLLQQRLTGPAIYQHIGRQDLTADVNFSDLLRWTTDDCCDSRISTLADFIAPHTDSSDAQLLDPDGAGHAFLVLDQAKA